jgi:3-ketosteroid 9alpha-monooxygenase subunit A
MYGGWSQVAFSAEVGDVLLPVQIARRALFLVRRDGEVCAYAATCPHRGAHLGYGGRLDGDAVVCPFHGHRIRLGCAPGQPLCVSGYRTLDVGGGIYVLPDDRHENGFGAFMERLADTHWLIPGFRLEAAIAPEYVIENVFDADHFVTVHDVNQRPQLRWQESEHGELTVEGILWTDSGVEWQGPPQDGASDVQLRFFAHVFSPTLVATELGPPDLPNVVITSATPTASGECTIRVVIAMPRGDPKGPPTVDAIGSLLAGSRTAFEQDMAIWEHLDPAAPSHFTRGDALVLVYRDFCARFCGPTA